MRAIALFGLGLAAYAAEAFVVPAGFRRTHVVMRAEADDKWSRSELLTTGALGALGASILTLGAPGANADTTLAQRKVQYFRYVPRIIAGRDFYAGDFKKAIDSKDWKAVAAAFVEESQAPEGSLRNNPRKSETLWQRQLFDPMRIYAQTFAERGVSDKLKALLEAEGRLEQALARIYKVSKGDLSPVRDDEPGFLFGLIGGSKDTSADPYAGKNQAQIAAAAWADGKVAFNDYVTLINQSISLSLNKIPAL